MKRLKDDLTKIICEALTQVLGAGDFSEEAVRSSFEIPREEKFGDLATHAILKIAKEKKQNPKTLAESVKQEITALLKKSAAAGRVEKISVEGPGFINFHFSAQEISNVVLRIHQSGENFGKPSSLKTKHVLLEFVSANPTGPLTVAHGRQAALGDSLARILSFCGDRVTKEYYNNDEGVQIDTLGASTWLRIQQILGDPAEMPETYYRGEYLIEIAKSFLEQKGESYFRDATIPLPDRIQTCKVFARDRIMDGIKKDLCDFGVTFDQFYSQEELAKSGKVEKALEELKIKGVVFEGEGALWLRSTDFGDDKDRVLIKSDKSYTYLTPDIAYHHEKFARGFDELIDILGPDHHGYVARLKASQEALGHDPEVIYILIAQLVTLYENGKQVRMSTRAGEFVTLRQILDEVGKDAGRFFFLMRKFDAHLDFDLSLAKSQTPENPVFYIQYAHARIESIKGLCREKGVPLSAPDTQALALLRHSSELRLMRLLSGYEEIVLAARRTFEPYRLVPYLMDLAGAFHQFYAEQRVVTDDPALTKARIALVLAIQTVLRSGLSLLGVSAPAKM